MVLCRGTNKKHGAYFVKTHALIYEMTQKRQHVVSFTI